MKEVTGEVLKDQIKLSLSGHIDSNNASDVEQAVRALTDQAPGKPVLIDAEGLEYISSAGLRVILRLRKTNQDVRIINVSPEVYDIFDMTGFTQMMTIEKAYRVVSVEGAEEIGRGANGTIYRIDQDNVVKVYNNADALEEIQHEREVARQALIMGIPTAISYDVVRVGDSYGSVFELLNAKSFSKIISEEPEKMDWCVKEYVDLLKKIHNTLVPAGQLPDLRDTVISWGEFLKPYIPEAAWEKLMRMFREMPHDDHLIHGDYHTKNVELVGDEVLLIDMDTLSVGHPIYELASMYNSFIGYSEYNHENVLGFQGFDFETAMRFWQKVLSAYLNTSDEKRIREIEDKARIIGYTRMIRRSIRRHKLETEEGRAEIELWKKNLLELLERTDSLFFRSNEMNIEATAENLDEVLDFVRSFLDEANCPLKIQMQIEVAVEEIFINIASYAYAPDKGNATVRVEVLEDPLTITIQFVDHGIPYDPLAKEDPDVTMGAEERQIGGLGIFMAKKSMDDISYRYEDGKNILTMKKNL